ncbi:PucR-like helix-turn-helix protein [Kribbella steppae]|uniref:PucR-like helix-turn-helix protein n=2 Tax=Kribbella steppae TaxID=2512223 RepID=A0A4R2HPP0_9ACTN|nr:PucR-like helix-turn-helix protein [Kribbella steppae]
MRGPETGNFLSQAPVSCSSLYPPRLMMRLRQTAADLHVHANTVDYRLRQVGWLTGLDPVRDDQLPRLVAALVAFDARSSPG